MTAVILRSLPSSTALCVALSFPRVLLLITQFGIRANNAHEGVARLFGLDSDEQVVRYCILN